MGVFAFALKSAGQSLTPDPFADWAEVHKRLDSFEQTTDDGCSRGGV
jgi:hypothetical protein